MRNNWSNVISKDMKYINFIEPTYIVKTATAAFAKFIKGEAYSNGLLHVKEFERSLSRYLKVKYCVCVNSGTAGLILAIKALGLDKEVIVPSFTFSGSVHALAWNGIVPKFVDIDKVSLNLDMDKVRQNITSKVTAILAVHMFGNPCDIYELEKIAKDHRLRLIFDSAHAFGSQYEGKMIGGFGDLEVFSFQTTKVLSTIEGGVVTTNSKDLYEKMLILRSQGNRGDGNCLYVGLNARIHPMAALLGRLNLKTMDKDIRARQKLGEFYFYQLSKVPGIGLQGINKKSDHNYQYIPIIIDKNAFGMSRDRLVEKLEKNNISIRKYFYPPVHKFNCYRHIKTGSSLKNTEFVSDNVICLPFYGSMRPDTIKYICKNILRIHQGCGRL